MSSKEKIYLVLSDGTRSYHISTFVIEKDGSWYEIDSRNRETPLENILLADSNGTDGLVLSTGGTIKRTLHKDGRTHFQIQNYTKTGFRTIKETIASAPPYFVKAPFRLLSFHLGITNLSDYPEIKSGKNCKTIIFNIEGFDSGVGGYSYSLASVESGKSFPNLGKAISLVCEKHYTELLGYQFLIFDCKDYPPLLIIFGRYKNSRSV